MSSYVKKILRPNEQVVGIAVLHWIIYIHGLYLTILGGLIGTFSRPALTFLLGEGMANTLTKPISIGAGVVTLVGIMSLLSAFTRQTTTEVVMTNHRLILKVGVISRATYEIMANRITGANLYQNFTGRLLGFGTVWVHGAGGEVSPISRIANPQVFQNAVMGVLEGGARR